ncbi:hypothetical protein [Neisseria shayeganii]|uniref:Uncharacterized protein n=1 Tax=Neisseria shayeganii 871 TaxID=1032488 RepID=G4CF94_9NEIS|nr:hypothetical protein HMPREF9371_0283 [Neisseria shayeganii 871]
MKEPQAPRTFDKHLYRHRYLVEKRRQMMQAWADYLFSVVAA